MNDCYVLYILSARWYSISNWILESKDTHKSSLNFTWQQKKTQNSEPRCKQYIDRKKQDYAWVKQYTTIGKQKTELQSNFSSSMVLSLRKLAISNFASLLEEK